MANQTTFTLSLDNDPIPDINSELTGLSENLKTVNSDFTVLINDLNTSIIPAFNSIKDLFTSIKSYSSISSAFLQHNHSLNYSGSLQDQFSPPSTNSFHDAIHKDDNLLSGATNLYKIGKLAGGDATAGASTATGEGLDFASNAFSAMDDLPGFLTDTAVEWGIGDIVAPEFVIPLQIAYSLLELFSDLMSTDHKSYKSSYLLSDQEFQQSAKVPPLPTGTHYDDHLQLVNNKDNTPYQEPLVKPLLPTGDADFNARYGTVMPIDDTYQTDPLLSAYKRNQTIYDNTNHDQPAAGNVNTNPCGCTTETIIVTNNYNNLIGQLTINGANLGADLIQVEALVTQALIRAVSDVHIKGLTLQ